jgi:hypothetical protein
MHEINCEKQMDMESLFSLLKEESSDANRIIKKKSSGSIRGDVATLSLEAFDAFKSPKMTDVEDFVFSNIIKPEWGGWDLVKDSSRNGDIKFWIKQAWDEKFPPDKGREDTRIIQKPKKGEVVQLCYWKQDEAAAPWELATTSLFGTSVPKNRPRKAFEGKTICTWSKGCKLEYSGFELDQFDLDVWMELARLCIEQNGKDLLWNDPNLTKVFKGEMSVQARFSSNSFLKSIERKPTGPNHIQLKKSLKRLCSAYLEVRMKDPESEKFWEFGGSMVKSLSRTGENKKRISICKETSQEVVIEYETGDFVAWVSLPHLRIYKAGRKQFPKALRRGLSSVAQWLHVFVLRQKPGKSEVRIDMIKLKEILGLEDADRNIRIKVSKAMNELFELKLVKSSLKRERNKKGELEPQWWCSSNTVNGESKYTLVFIPIH